MKAIDVSSFKAFGCPFCGCNYATSDGSIIGGTVGSTCRECSSPFVIVSDRYNTGDEVISRGEKAIVIEHYRKGVPAHDFIFPDPRPEDGNGEFWKHRGIGYDLSGFIKSKAAGERILAMVKDVLGKDDPKSWLDYREYEPEWIQFKMQSEEFDLAMLEQLTTVNGNVITKDILEKCKIIEGLESK